MTIAKRDIVELLLTRGDHRRAIRADDELPELVDPDLHARLLREVGLDPAQLQWDLGRAQRRFTRSRPGYGRHLAGRS